MQNEDIESLKTLVDTLESIHTELTSHKEITFAYDGIKYNAAFDSIGYNNLLSSIRIVYIDSDGNEIVNK